jgi:hypothetical protein
MQLTSFKLGQGLGRSLGMNASQVKRFIGVDIAYPRDPALVQQPWSDRWSGSGEIRVQALGRKGRRERFRAEALITYGPFGFVHHLQGAETAHVVVDEWRTGAQGEPHGRVGCLNSVPSQHESAGHTEVHHQDRTLVEASDNIFPPAMDGLELSAPQAGGESPGRLTKDVGVQHLETFDRFTRKCGEKVSNNGLDLR